MFVTWWPEGHYGYTWHFAQDMEEELRSSGVSIRRMSGQAFQPPGSLRRLAARARFLAALLKEASDADVLLAYMDSPPTRAMAALRRFGMLRETKFVIADFWVTPPRGDGKPKDRMKTAVLKHVYGKVDQVLINSRPGHDLFVREGYLGRSVRTAFVPSSEVDAKLDLMDEVRCQEIRWALPFDVPYFFSPGVSARDFGSVIEVARTLPDEPFAIMTKGTISDELPANVKLVPWGPYEEYLDILRASRAVIIPMKPGVQASGMRTFHEAWGLGVPVIIGKSEGLDAYLDYPEPIAYTYTPQDVAGLEAAVRAVIADPAEARMVADRAHSAVRALWSSRSYVERLMPHLEALLSRR